MSIYSDDQDIFVKAVRRLDSNSLSSLLLLASI